MNILVVGKFKDTEAFALHIANTLTKMQYSVTKFDPCYNFNYKGKLFYRLRQMQGVLHNVTDSIPNIRARRIRPLWQIVEKSQPDIIIVCHDFLLPDEVTKLKKISNAKIALWFPDALVNFARGYFMNAPYDALFFKDPYIVKSLSEVLASPVYYLPECFNPDRHYLPDGETPSDEYKCDITTAGTMHSWRVAFYKHLANYNVKLWGTIPPLWMPKSVVSDMYQGRFVNNQDKARAFLGAKIVLNNLHYGEIWGLNVRAFEAAGIGAFQMVDWRPGLDDLFEDGKEIISFKGIQDMKDKIQYWLDRPEERLQIAQNGKLRAYRDHTYELRLDLLISTLNGTSNGFPLPSLT